MQEDRIIYSCILQLSTSKTVKHICNGLQSSGGFLCKDLSTFNIHCWYELLIRRLTGSDYTWGRNWGSQEVYLHCSGLLSSVPPVTQSWSRIHRRWRHQYPRWSDGVLWYLQLRWQFVGQDRKLGCPALKTWTFESAEISGCRSDEPKFFNAESSPIVVHPLTNLALGFFAFRVKNSPSVAGWCHTVWSDTNVAEEMNVDLFSWITNAKDPL